MKQPIRNASMAAVVDRVRSLTWLDIAALAAFVALVLSLLLIQGPHDSIVRTEAIQVEFPAAQRVLGGLSPSSFGPAEQGHAGYPLLLAAATRIFGGNMFAAAKTLSSACAILFVLFGYLLVRQVFDARIALLSALLSMSMGGVLYVSCASGPETVFAFLAVASALCVARDPWPGPARAAIAGLLSGLAFAVRSAGMLLLLILALRLALVSRQGLNLRTRVTTVAIAGLCFALVGAVFLIAGSESTEVFIASQNSSAALSAGGSSSMGDSLQQWLSILGQTLERLFVGLPEIVRSLGRYPETGSWFLSTPLWVLAIIGLPLTIREYDRRKIWFIASLGLAWVAAAIALAGPPGYVVLVPSLAALAALPLTSGLLPDVLVTRRAGKSLDVVPGLLVKRLHRRRGAAASPAAAAGVSLTTVLLVGVLTVSALVTSVRTRQVFAKHRADDAYYQDIAEYLEASLGPGLHYPVGASSQSQARYWIPVRSGIPVAVLGGEEDFYSAIPELSFVLYDGAVDSLGGNSPMSRLSDPALTQPYLEAVYFEPSSPRVILYRLLDHASQPEIVDVSASSFGADHAPSSAADGQDSTWWTSQPQTSRDSTQSLNLDLGHSQDISRVWLLPRPQGVAFPAELHVEVSTDGQVWHQVVEPVGVAVPERQDPITLSFDLVSARFVRVSASRLRWDDDLRGYVASLAEVRIGSGKERPAQLAQFSLVGPGELGFDAVTHELVALVKNQGDVSGRVSAEFLKGWTTEESEYLGKVMSPEISAGAEGEIRLYFDGGDTLRPGHCRPIRVVLQAFGPGPSGLALDTYGMELPEGQETSEVVCSPEAVALDDFDYPESPLTRGWSASSASSSAPSVSVSNDAELGKRVMKIEAGTDGLTVVGLWVKIYDRPLLSFRIRSEETFAILLRVVTLADERFYVQYSPETWDTGADEYPLGKVVSFGLGKHIAGGDWSKISRDVANDFWTRTGLQIDNVELFGIRTEGSLEITDITLSTSQ